MEEKTPAQSMAVMLAKMDTKSIIEAIKALDHTIQSGIQDMKTLQGQFRKPEEELMIPKASAASSATHTFGSEEKSTGQVPGDGPSNGADKKNVALARRTKAKPVLSSNGTLPGELPRSIDFNELRKTADGPIPACTWIDRQEPTTIDINPVARTDKNDICSRPDQVTVHVRVVFLKLGEIDTVAEKFNADAFVQARWREPNLDGQHINTQFELCASDVFWDPKLYVENAMGEPKESIWQIVSFNERGEATVYQRRRVRGTFFERMELMQYPFDTQDLTLTISTERGDQEASLQADESEVSSVNIQSFVDEQEWHLHKHINTWTRVSTNVYQNSKHKHSAVSISCKATRRSQFFIWNIILVMVGICTLVFATFSVNLEKPENRIQLTFILLLSNITFKFTVNQTLPKVSYLTYLDKYILSSMAILCMVCIWHAIVPLLSYNMAMARQADIYAFVVLAGLYLSFNIVFFTWSKCLVSRRSREYSKKDAKQKEILTEMESKSNMSNQVAPI